MFQGSLIANMVMGVIILKKKYTLDKFISVGMISAGITICTIVSSQDVVSATYHIISKWILSIFSISNFFY